MTTAAEKVSAVETSGAGEKAMANAGQAKTAGGASEKAAGVAVKGPVPAPEKRKALGRGLESLLGGPRVVAGSAHAAGAAAPPAHAPAAAPPAAAASAPPSQESSFAPAAAVVTGVGVAPASASAGSAAVAVPAVGAPTGAVDAGIASGSSGNGAAIGDLAGVADGAALEVGAGDAAVADKSVRATQTDADRSVRATPAGATPASATQAGAQTATITASAAAAIHGAGGAALSTAIGAAVSEVIPEMMAQAHTREAKTGSPGASGAERRVAADGSEIVDIPVALIDKNPYQTRYFTHEDDEELLALSESIKAQGLIQPVTVRPGKDGRYFLITGWRRTQATKMAGLATIAAIVRRVSDQQAAEMTVIENLLREDLNCMDEVRAFVMLSQTFRMTQEQIAKRIGCSRERVSNYMRLARLPEEVQGFLRDNQLEFSHARMLLRLEDDQVILRVARKAAADHMSVEALEDLVREKAWPVEEEKKPGAARWVDPNVRAMQQSLERTLGLRVRIRDRRGKGNILIEYGSLEDFDRVVGMLGGKGGR